MTTLSTSAPSTERGEAIYNIFKDAVHPLTLTQAQQLHEAPKLPPAELSPLVEELVMQGRLFRCSPAGKTARYWAFDEEQKVRSTVEHILAAGRMPEAALVKKVNESLPKVSAPPVIKKVIADMQKDGRLHLWPGKAREFARQPFDPATLLEEEKITVRGAVEKVLALRALAKNALVKEVKKVVRKTSSPTIIEEVIAAMQNEGQLDVWPGKGKLSTLFLVKSFTAAGLLKKETLQDLCTVLGKAESLGVDLDQFLQNLRGILVAQERPVKSPPTDGVSKHSHQSAEDRASEPVAPQPSPATGHQKSSTPPMELMSLILKGMRDLDPAVETGATVLIRDLRRHMPAEYRGHESFDPAVLHLAEEGKIVLHRYEHPATLTDEERNELVRDQETGTYFTSLAHRVEEATSSKKSAQPEEATI